MRCRSLSIAAAAFIWACLQPAVAAEAGAAQLRQSQELVREFQLRLKAALESAISAGGAAAAIGICRDEAPAIAAELSARSGALVSRTSLRLRNPANAPLPWQAQAMQRFQTRKAGGAALEELETLESVPGEGIGYMKAIATQPLCVSCHGDALADDVRATLRRLYPEDSATGFAVGDLRGAFSVFWPAGSALRQ
jgi:hypothetical protein